MRLRQLGVVILLAGAVSFGCGSMATKKGFYEPVVAELRQGKYDSALIQIETAREKNEYGNKDRFIYFMDAGLANHYAGRYDSSNAKLELADAAAEELFTKSISKAVLSMMLNDNALDYAGEDYEVLYSDCISALNYLLLGNFEGAFVEVRQVHEHLNVLEDKYSEMARALNEKNKEDSSTVDIEYKADSIRFHNHAFARYLSMHMYAADGKYDDARIDYDYFQDAYHSQAQIYNFAPPRVQYQADSGNAVLSILAFAGLSPVKEDLSLRIRTDKDLNLVQVLYDDGEMEGAQYAHLPMKISEDYYFKFAIPKIVPRASFIYGIRVYANDSLLGEVDLMEDVYTIAEETFRAKKSLIFLKTVARAVVKGLAAHKLKEENDSGGLEGWLKKAAIDVATDLSENADLRSSQLLPGRIYATDFEVPAGVYDLTIEFLDSEGQPLTTQEVPQYSVTPGDFNLVQAVSLQ